METFAVACSAAAATVVDVSLVWLAVRAMFWAVDSSSTALSPTDFTTTATLASNWSARSWMVLRLLSSLASR